ncbi:hypothetical protein BaRGS_00022113 [Batillaria attramentaria]|uniref:Pectin acetylesterase n=1 Tax=Batillaria attramentaria TaxID=370345 RepID=A0ABD0KHN7_9CAEN
MSHPRAEEQWQHSTMELASESETSARQPLLSIPQSKMYAPAKFSRFQVLPPVLCTRRVYMQVACVLFVALIVFLVRAMSAMRHTFVQYHLETDTDGELVILPTEFAQARGALCLDGSPPAYYYRQSIVPAVRFWIIHLQPGGWCTTPHDCFERSTTPLGSSMETEISTNLKGIMSSDCDINPDFCIWHIVDFLYCDGGSFLGNRSDPLTENSKKLYLRGALIFDTLIEHLQTQTLFRDAEQIILAGSSAGGLGAMIHADRLRERLPPSVKTLHVLLDGSLFLDMPDVNGLHTMGKMLKEAFQLHHAHKTESIKECTRMMNNDEEWRCILPEVFHKYVFSPMFFLNSLHDKWYRYHALNIKCPVSVCTQEHLREVHNTLIQLVDEGKEILRSKKNGVFFTPCPAHTMLIHKNRFRRLMSRGRTVQQAVGAWVKDEVNSRNFTEVLSVEDVLKFCPLSL